MKRHLFRTLAIPAIALALGATAVHTETDNWAERLNSETDIDRLGRLYLELLLEEDPTGAAQIGIHGKGDADYYYDRRMPDPSAEARKRFSAQRAALQEKLAGIDPDGLSRPEQIDLHILTKRVAYHRMVAEELNSHENPMSWTGSLGSAFSGLVLRDYAPLEDRLVSFGARCEQTPAYLAGARKVLAPDSVTPSETRKAIALSNLKGMTRAGTLFDKTLPELLASSGLDESQANAIRANCEGAVASINEFATWFEETVVPRENGEWRLGKEVYDRKYDLQLDYPLSPDELLERAEQWLDVKSAELVSVGRKIHDQYLAAELEAGSVQPAAELDDQQVVRDIFTKLSEDRSTVDTLIEDSYALADSIIGFVEEQNLMDLPPASKLRIESIPPHLSGVAVAMIATAPPFEPELESVWFWDLPLLSGSEDFLKEYNRSALAVVYIHEGVPGHFVQLEYSNRAERLIPKVFWNGAMVEGWAAYITTQMVEQGYTVYPDEPWGHDIQKMVDDKMVLRSIMNAIIDIRFHRTDYSEEDALQLMTDRGFQEQSEARGKLVRAKVSSVQLASYFAGHSAIEEILAEYRERMGDAFSYKDFNERLVGAGSPPFFAIREFMLGELPEVDKKAVLITGASSGIGRATAEHLAKAGYFVYAGARKESDIEALNQIENVRAVRLDVTKPEEIASAVKVVEAGGHGLWGIVNNAGVNVTAPLIEATDEQLEFLFNVNVYGVFRVTKAFAPLVIASKGRIVNISSISGVLSGYGYGMYAMSKHAVEAYTDTLAREMEELGVFVAAVEPGNYRSQIGVTRCERLLADADQEPYRFFKDYQEQRRQRCRDWLAEGAPNENGDPMQVAVAVEHALFSERPKDHYLVVPRQVEAGWTIMKAMEELLMLNGGHDYSYSREELIELMNAFWPYTTGEKSFDDEEDEKAFGEFAEGWLSKGEANPDE